METCYRRILGVHYILICKWSGFSLTFEQILLFVAPCMCVEFRVRLPPLASYPGYVGGGTSGLVSTVCACEGNFTLKAE